MVGPFKPNVGPFGLEAAPLRHLADIVRGADTARPELAPEAPGLLAASSPALWEAYMAIIRPLIKERSPASP